MKALILETSTEKSCLLFVSSKGKCESRELPGGPALSKTLGLEVKKLLPPERHPVDKIFVGQGPGSYTGIRVGAALAKGLGFGWKVPVYGFCSLKVFTPDQTGPFAILVDAKMGGFYLLLGERSNSSIQYEEPELISEQSLEPLLKSVPTIVSPHPLLIKARVSKLHILESHPNFDLMASWAFSPAFETPLELVYPHQKH